MGKQKYAKLYLDDDIVFDNKAHQVKDNPLARHKTRFLSAKLIWNLANAIDAILDTEESMALSDELYHSLQNFAPNSDGMNELFSLWKRGNAEEAAHRHAYREKYGKNPSKKYLLSKRKYFLPRIIEEL